MQQRFGAQSLGESLAAAIDYAANGFPVSPIIASQFQFPGHEYPSLARIYQPDGNVPQYGDLFRNPMLAASLQKIADDGAVAFYEGEIAHQIEKEARNRGGFMRMRDLRDHRATWVEPVSANYRGWDVWEIPPNGQGIAALQILNLLEQFDIASLQPNSADHLHIFVEAKKLVFEDRARYYADTDFANVPVEWLISKDYARRTSEIDRSPPGTRRCSVRRSAARFGHRLSDSS